MSVFSKRQLMFLMLIFSCFVVQGQAGYYVTGSVFAAENHAPMFGATVFAENTTFATATDSLGRFRLYLPAGGYSLAASFTGYSTQNIRISQTENKDLVFELPLKEKTMQEVAVVSTGEVKDGWEKYGQKFLDEFIGKSPNSRHCRVINPEAARFYFSKRKNRLKVLASDPLIIENNALGYKLTYELDSFVYEYNTEISVYTGFPKFEAMHDTTGLMKASWDSARLTTYKGSVMHFMRSVYHQNCNSESFELGFVRKINDRDSLMKSTDLWSELNYRKDSTGLVTLRPMHLRLGVLFTEEGPNEEYLRENNDQPSEVQFSVMVCPSEKEVHIEQNGFYYDQNDVLFYDYWSWEKVADALPYDYNP